MTAQSNMVGGVKGVLARVPQLLVRVLIIATVIYFVGFIWTFTGGTFTRLFIPYQWHLFFSERLVAETLEGHWFLYGTSFVGLFINWLALIALISGAYYAYAFVVQTKAQGG